MKVGKYVNTLPFAGGLLVHNSLNNATMKMYSDATIRAFTEMQRKDTFEDDPSNTFLGDLKNTHIVVNDDVDEVALVNYAYSTQNRYLHVFLIVTRQCNFRCPYCYQDHTGKTMAWKTYLDTINFILKVSEENKTLSDYILIDFFGGEPLIEAENIISFMNVLRGMLTEKNSNANVVGHITSNGYLLTPSVFSQLVSCGVNSFQITLDGFSETHNKSRYLAGGQGSWSRIVENLKAAHSTDLEFHMQIRCNYTQDILDSMNDYLVFLKENFGMDSRFAFYFEAAKDYGTVESGDDLSIVKDEAHSTEMLYNTIMKSGLAGASMDNRSYLFLLGATCYAANLDEVVIDYDGTLRKCTFNLDDCDNKIGQIDESGAFHFDLNALASWTSYELSSECKQCMIYPICYGRKCPNVRSQASTPSSDRCQTLIAHYNTTLMSQHIF